MKQIRVGIDARILSQKMGGVGRYTCRLIQFLKEQTNIHIYLFTDTPLREEYASLVKSAPVIYKKKISSNLKWKNKVLPNLLLQHDIDVYHCTWGKGIPIHSPCPTIMTIHDLFPLTRFSPYNKRIFKKFKFWLLHFVEARHASKIVAVSEATKEDIITKLFISPAKIEVIYLDCDREKIESIIKSKSFSDINQWGLSPQKYFICIAGDIDAGRKNVDYLVKAFYLYCQNRQDSYIDKLVIVGEYKEDSRILKMIKELNLQGKIILTGHIEDEILYVLLKKAYALILVTLYEGFGIPILEGYFLNVPVITGNNSAMREIGEDAAFKVDPLVPNSLSKAMNDIQDANREQLILKGRQSLKRYSWNTSMKKILNIYRDLTNWEYE